VTATTADAVRPDEADEAEEAPPGVPPPIDRSDRTFPVRRRRMAVEALLAAGVPWLWAVVNYRLSDISP